MYHYKGLNRGGNQRSKGQGSSKNNSQQHQNRAHQVASNDNNNKEFDLEPFAPGPIAAAFMVAKRPLQSQKTKTGSITWFLNLCASRYLCNDQSFFSNTRAKSIDFVTAAGQVIQTKEIGTVLIPLVGGNNIELHNVALAPGCNSNLISLRQLRESGITYYNDPAAMTLMRNGEVIARAKRDRNLFTLDLAQPRRVMTVVNKRLKAMAITERGQLTHLVSQNKCIRLWH